MYRLLVATVAFSEDQSLELLGFAKKEVQDLLSQHDLPFVVFYTGLFAEFLPHFLGYHYDEGYMTVVGKGETAFSITSRTDVIRDLVETKLNKKIELRYVDLEENKKNFNTDFVAFLTTIFEEGRGVAGTEQEVADTAAKFFPDWNPAKYESFIA
uniref:NmrA-like domain-containing protein n=1 Tax=Phytophthora fragariae TaxID=53985 RepID=A0A6A3E9S5_9STRA|nr:hypothetical protein PF009_g23132 [Phytophthora fragariae]